MAEILRYSLEMSGVAAYATEFTHAIGSVVLCMHVERFSTVLTLEKESGDFPS